MTTSSPQITVHHLKHSRSHRVVWLLEELGLPYQIKTYERNSKTLLAPPELKALHPLGKSPVLTDTSSGQTVAESAVVLSYLLDRYDEANRFHPGRLSAERLRYDYWMHYSEGSAMSPLLLALVFEQVVEKAPLIFWPAAKALQFGIMTTYIQPELEKHMQFWEDELGRSLCFVGDHFTAADIMMSFPLEAAQGRGDTTDYPRIEAYLEKLRERPAYRKAIEVGGPIQFKGKK